MKKILVAGAGQIGKAIAVDLSSNFDVSVVDSNIENLFKLPEDKVDIIAADFNDRKNFTRVINEFDIIVGALPGFLGFEFIKTCICLKKDVVDISFCKEDVFALNELAVKNNVTVIFDCGLAPGLSNIIIGYYSTQMQVNLFECYVGGLPVKRIPPYEYKAPFSPADVIEEYTRPARVIENGKVIIKPALSEREIIELDSIGKLEAFNTDGLRSLIYNIDVPNMKEKTLRYPGHVDKIILLKESGLLSNDAVEINGVKVKPIDITCRKLFDLWKLNEGDDEFTVLKIIIEGTEGKKWKRIEYYLFDRHNKDTGTTSMARTTGYTCTAVVNLLAGRDINKKGVLAPEIIGKEKKNFEFVINYLKDRNVKIELKS